MKWRFAYIMSDSNGPCVKVGVSNNVASRLVNLQCRRTGVLSLVATYERLQEDALLVERVAHHLLEDKRISDTHSSEWFSATDEDATRAVAEAIRLIDTGDISFLKKPRVSDQPAWSGTRQKRKPKTYVRALRIPGDLLTELEFMAAQDSRPLSSMLIVLVQEAVETRRAADPVGMQLGYKPTQETRPPDEPVRKRWWRRKPSVHRLAEEESNVSEIVVPHWRPTSCTDSERSDG